MLDLEVLDLPEVLEDQEVILQILEVVEVLQQLAPSGTSRCLMASAPDDLEEGPDVSIEPEGQHLEKHEPRDEDLSSSPCTVS